MWRSSRTLILEETDVHAKDGLFRVYINSLDVDVWEFARLNSFLERHKGIHLQLKQRHCRTIDRSKVNYELYLIEVTQLIYLRNSIKVFI